MTDEANPRTKQAVALGTREAVSWVGLWGWILAFFPFLSSLLFLLDPFSKILATDIYSITSYSKIREEIKFMYVCMYVCLSLKSSTPDRTRDRQAVRSTAISCQVACGIVQSFRASFKVSL